MIRISKLEARKIGLKETPKTRGTRESTSPQAVQKQPTSAKSSGIKRKSSKVNKTNHADGNHKLRLMTYHMPQCKLGPEDREAKELSDQLRLWTLNGDMNCVWWHTASELAGGRGKSSQVRYSIAKSLGLIPGSPDYVFLHAEKGAFALELKATKGVMTEAQKDFQAWCYESGIPYVCAHGAEKAIEQILEWGLVKDHKDGSRED